MSEEQQDTPVETEASTSEEQSEDKKDASEIEGTIIDVTEENAHDEKKKLKFEKSFTYELVSTQDGTRYYGQFTVKRMALGDFSKAGVIKARLNAGEFVDANVQWLHEMLSFCSVSLTAVPDWWKPEEFYEWTMLEDVYAHARAYQDSFRRRSVG